jgi:hypothetical protein
MEGDKVSISIANIMAKVKHKSIEVSYLSCLFMTVMDFIYNVIVTLGKFPLAQSGNEVACMSVNLSVEGSNPTRTLVVSSSAKFRGSSVL